VSDEPDQPQELEELEELHDEPGAGTPATDPDADGEVRHVALTPSHDGGRPQPPRPPRRTGVFLDPDDLRVHVGDLLRALLGGYEVDPYGNFTFTHEGARVFVTVGGTAMGPQVGVLSITNVDVELTPQLAGFLLTTNHQLGFGSFSYDTESRAVWLRHTLLGTTLDGPELQAALMAVASTAAHFDDVIEQRFDGRPFVDADEDTQKHTRPPDPADQQSYPDSVGDLEERTGTPPPRRGRAWEGSCCQLAFATSRRWCARRCRSVRPPQTPKSMSLSSAYWRHSSRTLQRLHTLMACRDAAAPRTKNCSGSRPRHLACSAQSVSNIWPTSGVVPCFAVRGATKTDRRQALGHRTQPGERHRWPDWTLLGR
jgi:hypothetical protein